MQDIVRAEPPGTASYDVFISYRHGGDDQLVAELLHRNLEAFRTPSPLVARGLPRRLTRVFRDRDELQTSSDLSDSIRTALAASRFLVAICSPRAKASQWVNREIEEFRALGKGKQILALLIEGEPDAAFPAALFERRMVRVVEPDGHEQVREEVSEPLAADIRAADAGGRKRLLKIEILRLLAPVIGCSFDDLRQREHERARRRLIAASAASISLAVVFAGLSSYALVKRGEAERQAVEAAYQRDQARQIRDEALRSESQTLATFSVQKTLEGDAPTAETLALRGLPQSAAARNRPLVPQTASALQFALRSDRLLGEHRGSAQTEGEIVETAFTADGRTLAAGTNTGTIMVFDAAHRMLIRRYSIPDGGFESLSFSPDGMRLAAAGGRKPVVIDLRSNTITPLFISDGMIVMSVRFGPNGKYVIGGTGSNFAVAWDALTGKPLKTYEGIDPDEGLANFLRETGQTHPAASESAASNQPLPLPPPDPSLADDPNDDAELRDAKRKLAAAKQKLARVEIKVDQSFSEMIDSFIRAGFMARFGVAAGTPFVELTADGKYLATTGRADPEGAVRIFEVATGKLVVALKGHGRDSQPAGEPALIPLIRFSPDGTRLASAGSDNTVRLWEIPSGRQVAVYPNASAANAVAFDGDGSRLAVGYEDGTVRIIGIASGATTSLGAGQKSAVKWVAFSPDRNRVTAATTDGWIRTWWAQTGTLADEVLAHRGAAWGASYSRDGAMLVSYGADATLRWWRSGDPHLAAVVRPPPKPDANGKARKNEPIISFGFAPGDARLIGSESYFGATSLIDAGTGRIIARLGRGRISVNRADGTLGLHPDSATLVRFDLATGAPLTPSGPPAPEPAANEGLTLDASWVLAPTGLRAAGNPEPPASDDDDDASDEKAAATPEPMPVLIDVPSRKVLATLAVENLPIRTPIFSRSGNVVLGELKGECCDGRIAAWDADTGAALGMAKFPLLPWTPLVSADGGFALLRFFDTDRPTLLDIRNGLRATPLDHDRRGLTALAISEHGGIMVAGFEDGTVGVWTKNDGRSDYVWRPLPIGIHSPIATIAVSESHAVLAVADRTGTVRLWNLDSQVPLAMARLPRLVNRIELSASGARAALLDDAGEIHVLQVHGGFGDAPRLDDIIDVAQAGQIEPRTADAIAATSPSLPLHLEPLHLPPSMPVAARPAALAACDRLVSHPGDRDRQADPVGFEQIKVDDALAACKAAVAAAPDDRLSLFHLGRVLERAKLFDEAKRWYRAAGDRGHAIALRGLGQLAALEHNDAEAGALMTRAAQLGDPTALWVMAQRYAAGGDLPQNPAEAIRHAAAAWRKPFAQTSTLLAWALADAAADDAAMARALFFYALGDRLDPNAGPEADGMDGRAMIELPRANLDAGSPDGWSAEQRAITARALPPARIVAVQRAARAYTP